MKIKFLGTRGEAEGKSTRHAKQSGLLITSGGHRLLVDCGEKSHLDTKPDAVIITHTHIDHIKGLKGSEIEPKLVEADKPQTFGPFSVAMFPVEHSVMSPSHGYRIEAEDKVIIVTGDILSIPDRKILEGADIYIGDGSTLERDIERVHKETGEKYGHASAKKQVGWCEDAGIKNIMFTHFGKVPIGMHERTLRKVVQGFAKEAKVMIGFDGFETKDLREAVKPEDRQRMKINSPTFAYMAVYNKEPDEFLPGRTGAEERTWKGIPVDVHIKDSWLEALNAIKGIELRASCEGHDKKYIAYVVFRLKADKDSKAEAVAKHLSTMPAIFSKSDTGMEDRPRIVVAGKTWHGQSDWESWWSGLAEKIQHAVDMGLKEASLSCEPNKLRESLREGKETFDPTGWDTDSVKSYLNAFNEVVNQSLYLDVSIGQSVFDGRWITINRPKRSLAFENFNALRSDKKEFGFIRFSSPKETISGFEYSIRDFIPWPTPKPIDVISGTLGFAKREQLQEALFVAKQFTPEELKKLTDEELLQRHELIHQIFMERGARKDDELIINANRFVQEEFGRRKMGMPLTPDNLDQYTLQLFKPVVMESIQEGLFDEWMVETAKKMAEVGPIVVIPKFVNWTGSTAFVKDRLPDDADVIVRSDSITDGLAVLLDRLWQKFAETSPCLHSSPEGPNWRFLATHDLVLVPRKDFQFEEVQGEGFRQAFYENAPIVEPDTDEHDDKEPLVENLQERVLDAKKMPLYSAVLQNHWRRKSSHFDFRVKMNDHLEGFTIAAMPEGVVKEDVDTITKAKEMQGKLDWKFAPDMDPKKHVLAFKKAKQPLVWLGIEDEVIKPGDVGATTEGAGVILRIARGKAYPGVDKKHFKEFFLDMGSYKGRTVFVLQPVAKEKGAKKETVWQTWTNLEEQTPYLLSRRGRMLKDYTPPEGESRLPPEWEKKIKPELRWWDKGIKPAERLKRLDLAYNDLIEREILKGRLLKT